MSPTIATSRQRYSKAVLVGLLVLLGSIGLMKFAEYQQQQYARQSTAKLADIIIVQLSSGASKAMLTGDQLALQSLVQEMVQHPSIAAAAIFDTGDRPLAVAGSVNNDSHIVMADIIVDDSIAGFAQIALSANPDWFALQDPWLMLAILCLASLAFLVTIASPVASTELTDETNQPDIFKTTANNSSALVSLNLTAKLATGHPLPAMLNRVIGQVCKLYDGDRDPSATALANFVFRGQDSDLRAFCAARLWQQWLLEMEHRYPGLGINIIIRGPSDLDIEPNVLTPGSIYLTREVLAGGHLANRISIVEEDDDWYRVLSVNSEFQQLLQRQLARLLPTGDTASAD